MNFLNAIAQVTASTFWNYDTTLEQKREIYANASSNMDALRDITPHSGAYFVRSALVPAGL